MEDLQEYVEILKAELEASKKREKARKVSIYVEYSYKLVFREELVLRVAFTESCRTFRNILFSPEEPGYWYGWSECGGPGASYSSYEASRRKTSRRK